ncbi:MAG: Thioredoxin reductase [Myxococcaceae bacterium]|nr:Thioredoxin reductase [Myxococcaceae bacterium]
MNESPKPYDVVIIGGGPGGLSAALALGRSRKRVLLCDAGPRRNAAATKLHNFVTRDGTPPDDFRRIGREQLGEYPSVEVRDLRVDSIVGDRGDFRVALSTGEALVARRVLLCTGMVDEMLPLEGFRELWGRSIFQCPYCHGWELRDRAWGYLALPHTLGHAVPFAIQTRAWTSDVTLFTNGLALPEEGSAQLVAAGVRVVTGAVSRLVARDGRLASLALADGSSVACDALFAHPPQRHVPLVGGLGLALDDDGFVKVDPMKRETSAPGIYAGGDVTTRGQSAVFAASSALQAAAMINLELTLELAASGALP